MKKYFYIVSVDKKVDYNDTDDCVRVGSYMNFKGSLVAKTKLVDLSHSEYYNVYINDVMFQSLVTLEYEKEIDGYFHTEFTINEPYIKDSFNLKDLEFYIKTLDGKEDSLCKNLNKHIYKMDTLIESIFSFITNQEISYCVLEV